MAEPILFSRRETKAGRAQVFAAADRALSSGHKPTQDSIRQDLGGGSYGSINAYLKDWYRELGSRLQAAEAPIAGLPVEASGLLHQLWRLAQAGAGLIDGGNNDAERGIAETERVALQSQNKALETLNTELQRHRGSAERSLSEARALLARREAALEDERAARIQTEQSLVRLRMELDVLKERRAITSLVALAATPTVVRRRVLRAMPKKERPSKASAQRPSAKKARIGARVSPRKRGRRAGAKKTGKRNRRR